MSKRNKLEKFAEVLTFPNVYENFNPKDPRLVHFAGVVAQRKGKWAQDHFGNDHPITLELACGRGEYTLALAEAYPDHNFIGVDIKGARIWKGAKQALDKKMQNVAFLRTRIEQLDLFFSGGEVEEIWITFPDPFLKKSKANRRLTAPNFLKKYKSILKSNGVIHLKTDDPTLYQYSLESFRADTGLDIEYFSDDIYSGKLYTPELEFKTYYEHIHLEKNKKIKYIKVILK